MGKHNHFAIVLAVVFQQGIGFLWYGVLFQGAWVAGVRMEMADMHPEAYMFILDIVGAFLICYGISWLLGFSGGYSMRRGVRIGSTVWLLFLGVNLAAHQAFYGHTAAAMLVDGSVELLNFVVSGVIVGAWAPKTA